MSELHFIEIEDCDIFKCHGCRWQLVKGHGFSIGSGPMDYYAEWFNEHDGKWRLYIGPYEDNTNWKREKKLIETANTIFEVFQYMSKNKHPIE